MSLSGKYNFPVTTEAQADDVPAGSIKPALKAWQAEQLDYKNTGWTAENVADFILHCCSEQGVQGGSELVSQVEAAMTETGQTPRVVGAQAVREVLKAWNQAQAAGGTVNVPVKHEELEPLVQNEEIARYSVLHKEYAALPFNMNRAKRTGWTRLPDGYQICFIGSDKADWVKIVLLFIALYAGLILFFWGMLEATLASDALDDRSALWTFFVLFFCAWAVLAVAVHGGNKARAAEEERAAAHEV